MKKLRLRLVFLVLALAFGPLAPAMAEAESGGVLITEFQTGGSGSGTAGHEFVKLHNAGLLPVDVTGWKLQYRAANKLPADPWPVTSTTTISYAASVQGECRVVINSYESVVVAASALGLDDAPPLNGGFADAGGQLRLVDTAGMVSDMVGYGTALDYEGAPVPKPSGGESAKRKVDQSGSYIDSGNNSLDFTLSCGPPEPQEIRAPLVGTTDGCALFEQLAEDPELPDEEPPQQEAPEVPGNSTLQQLLLTEIFPDPANPQTDSEHEFVEIYNPNDVAVELAGYTIKTGDSQQAVVGLQGVVNPGQYFVVTSAGSSLSLVNSGARVVLLDAQGQLVDESPNYQQAQPGQSWSRSEDSWQWSLTPTPGLENVITLPIEQQDPDDQQHESEADEQDTYLYLPVQITELLPDPESPAQDATDEFIELFNPNNVPVNLKGYQLQSGSNFRYKFILPEVMLGPGEYIIFTSEDSGLALSNSGTGVRVLDPNSLTLDEVGDYGKAVEGQTWAKTDEGTWRWSTTPTPAGQNRFTSPPPKASKAAAKKTTATKKTAAKAKVASVKKEDPNNSDPNEFREPPESPANLWLLGGVGSMALGYGVYEYRQSLLGSARKLWQLIRGKPAEE